MLQKIRNFFTKTNKVIAVNDNKIPESETKVENSKAEELLISKISVSTAQSNGLVRDHNEDALFALSSILQGGKETYNFGLFIVADGMGGHLYGEVASNAAVRALISHIISNLNSSFLSTPSDMNTISLHELVEEAVCTAQNAVVQKAPGGGTTLTAALLINNQVTIAHVGDSRCFFIFPDGKIQSMTQDHSLVQRLVELGEISAEEAATYPQKNILYRALGQSEPFKPDISTHALPSPGYLLLCSDGLWGVVTNEEIARIINTSDNISDACNHLINAANLAGGPDNISVILVKTIN